MIDRGIETEDVGCFDTRSVDYPDYAREVAARVAAGRVDQGILVCTTGIGMTIAANKFPRVRAALCHSPEMACMVRTHNDANILTLGAAQVSVAEAVANLDVWLLHQFGSVERHARRLHKLVRYGVDAASAAHVASAADSIGAFGFSLLFTQARKFRTCGPSMSDAGASSTTSLGPSL